MALSSAVRSQIIARGYSPGHIDQWIASHPGDEGRALTAFPQQSSSSGSSSSSASAPSSLSPSGSGSSSSTAVSGLAGLQVAGGLGGGAGVGGAMPASAATAPQGGADLGDPAGALAMTGGGTGQPMNLAAPAPGSLLRQGMGNRIYPMESAALAGLRKAY